MTLTLADVKALDHWTNENVFSWNDNGPESIFCPEDMWELINSLPGWQLKSARSEWPWHVNGSQIRDIYLQFVFTPKSRYNQDPFELLTPAHSDPRDRDDHILPQGITTQGEIRLWSERGDYSCGVVFVVFAPGDDFLQYYHFGG